MPPPAHDDEAPQAAASAPVSTSPAPAPSSSFGRGCRTSSSSSSSSVATGVGVEDARTTAPTTAAAPSSWIVLLVVAVILVLGSSYYDRRRLRREGGGKYRWGLPVGSSPGSDLHKKGTVVGTLRSNRTRSSSSSSSSSSYASSSYASTTNNTNATPATSGGAAAAPDSSHDDWCDRRHIRDGRWVPAHLPRPPYLPPGNRSQCAPFDAYLSNDAGWDTYAWLPRDARDNNNHHHHRGHNPNSTNSCRFTAWDADRFCRLAKYSTVLIVGDSLSWEHYVSLGMLLGVPLHHGYQDQSRIGNVNIGHAVCHGLTRIVYRRDDGLSKLSQALYDTTESNATIPQILVLNRGAHYANDETLIKGLASALDVVQLWLETCDAMNLTCHFFWRTTVPGHAKCHDFAAPVHDLPFMEAYIGNRSNYDSRTIQFHWQDFRRQNEIAEAELTRRRLEGQLTYRVLDGYRLNVLRPDDHTDCLHSCLPGKADVYPQLMLHYLRMDRTKEDVQRLEDVFYENRWYLNVSTVSTVNGHV